MGIQHLPRKLKGPDLIVRNGRVVTPDGAGVTDVAIQNGRIAAVGPVRETASDEFDASGCVVLPGVIDPHVHFNEPGRTQWEGFETGSLALAAGGGTCYFDMPLNSHPPVLDAEALERKRERAQARSTVDFALWGGLTPDSLDAMEAMADAGAIGFKAFLCESGIPEFRASDWTTLKRGLAIARRVRLPVAVHAEDPDVLARHAARARDGSVRGFLDSRPPEAETRAIRRACDLAGETGAALHVVHASCPEAVRAVHEARAQGVDVSVETCPHYLLYDEHAVETRLGVAKCTPPLRDAAAVAGMWNEIAERRIDILASDHSPAPPEMKTGKPFAELWGGVAGCQHGFCGFLTRLRQRGGEPDWVHIAALWSGNAARRFRIAGSKGGIREGLDADLTVLREIPETVVRRGDLKYRHTLSIYEGFNVTWRVERTYLRGNSVTEPSSRTRARFIQPERG